MALLVTMLTATTAWAQTEIDGLTYNATDGCYDIGTVAELQAFETYANSNDCQGLTFRLTGNIDMTGQTHAPTGNTGAHGFWGTFNGNSKTITGLTGSNGLFNDVGHRGKVIDLTLSEVNISGDRNIGGLAGICCGVIERCHVTGSVSGTGDRVGGITGSLSKNNASAPVLISNCTFSGSVSCNFYGGGIAGYSNGTVTGCTVTNSTIYATWNMDAVPANIGGVVGVLEASIIDETTYRPEVSNCTVKGVIATDVLGKHYGKIYGIILSSTDPSLVTISDNIAYYNVTAGEGVTITYESGDYVTYNDIDFYEEGSTFTLAHGDVPQGYTGFGGYNVTDLNGNDITATAVNGTTLTLPANDVTVSAHWYGSFEIDGNSYTIHNATGWDMFCDALLDNDTYNRFSGKTVKLGADISVSRMAGADYHDFLGTFDGDGHTLTFTATATDSYLAPFSNVLGNSDTDHAVIRNLKVETNITANDYRHMAGLIAKVWGYVDVINCDVTVNITATKGSTNTDLYPAGIASQVVSSAQLTVSGCTVGGTISTDGKYAGGIVGIAQGSASITNSVSSVTIDSSTEGDGTHGGLVAVQGNYDGSTITIEGCVFNGKLLGSSTTCCCGFVGWRQKTVNISNSLFDPAEVTIDGSDSYTFSRRSGTSINNSYYTQTFGTPQGKQARSITAGEHVTVANAGNATEYTVSHITAYGTGIKYDSKIYAGSGDDVNLTLSNDSPDAPLGYRYADYTVSGGTLTNNGDGSFTLEMPDADVTVSVDTNGAFSVIDWATVNSGDTEDDAYIIYNKDQLNLLAYRVNGTHGQPRRGDGYFGKFFRLGDDIAYSYTSNWNDIESTENNYEAIGRYNGGTFCGDFDGADHTISGIRMYDNSGSIYNDYLGIFGLTGNGANIHDILLADSRISGSSFIAGIVGENNGGTITRCHVTADVANHAVAEGDAFFHGGIVGRNQYNSTVSYCTSAATFTFGDVGNRTHNYGGIAGINYSTLTDNLAIGVTIPKTTQIYHGAIVGQSLGESAKLLRNYYKACKIASESDTPSGVGCKNADVTANDGAVPGYFLTLDEGITANVTSITIPKHKELNDNGEPETVAAVTYHVAAAGATVTLTVTPPNGYDIASVSCNGTTIAPVEGVYSFTMPAEDVTINAVFIANSLLGDVNRDGLVNISDVIAQVNIILGNGSEDYDMVAANMNGDEEINISDVIALVNIILHGE